MQAAERCDEREARRQIGNAITDRKLLVRWADKPKIPPMPGSKFSWMPVSTGRQILPDDTPPREATYWLECLIDPSCADRVLEPPIYDLDTVDALTAKRLDKERRFRKPIFGREHALRLWPDIERVRNFENGTSGEAKPTKFALREKVAAEYQERLNSFLHDKQRYPSRDEDRSWGKERKLGRERIRELREKFVPAEIRRGGAPRKRQPKKPDTK